MRFHSVFNYLLDGLLFTRKGWAVVSHCWVEFDPEKQEGNIFTKSGDVVTSEPWSPSWPDLMIDDWIVYAEDQSE